MNQKKPLDGIRVLDFTQALSGVYCAMYLGDFGADVIKIERRGSGDQSREWGPFQDGESAYFATYNRSKRSLALDLSAESGKQIVRELVKGCDIVLENFKTGTLDKLGLGYDALKELNPQLIYGSISGYGTTGPLAYFACYDVTATARSGLLMQTGSWDDPPTKPGMSIGDNWAGTNLLSGISMALLHRQATGEGSRLDISMLDGMFYMQEVAMMQYFDEGENLPARTGNHDTLAAPCGSFPTKDGYLALSCFTEGQWHRLCTELGMTSLETDPRFASRSDRITHLRELEGEMGAYTAPYGKLELERKLQAAGIPAGAVMTTRELVEEDEQAKACAIVDEIEHPRLGRIHVGGLPIKLSLTPGDIKRRPAPALGEHTDEILAELAYTPEQIAALREQGVVG